MRQAQAGMTVVDLCRTQWISDGTFNNWRSKFGVVEVADDKRQKVLETENRLLKQLQRLADALLENKTIKDVLAKKVVTPATLELVL